ncbi:MAG: pyridoxamine 5'-phosphate oxidase family protein [Bdellovibrionaceae bacterium]|nr:pyridoxamine 5'-phosphate oxidase family protein [Pseudobdellovibrionaceae bacterium]
MKTAEFAELVQGIRFAMFTTSSLEGGLSSRPLTVQEMTAQGDLFFLISDTSTLAEEVRANGRVNATLTKPESSIYVSLVGSAEVTHDQERIDELWSIGAQAFFPRGPKDPDLALLHMRIESAELWDSPSSRIVQAWKFAKAIVTGEKASDAGRHKSFEFEVIQT